MITRMFTRKYAAAAHEMVEEAQRRGAAASDPSLSIHERFWVMADQSLRLEFKFKKIEVKLPPGITFGAIDG